MYTLDLEDGILVIRRPDRTVVFRIHRRDISHAQTILENLNR